MQSAASPAAAAQAAGVDASARWAACATLEDAEALLREILPALVPHDELSLDAIGAPARSGGLGVAGATAALPLVVGDEPVAVLRLRRASTAPGFTDAELARLALVAVQAAQALGQSAGGANLRAQLEIIENVASHLNRLIEVEEVAVAIAQELRAIVAFSACRVYLLDDNGTTLRPVAFDGTEAYSGESVESLIVEVGEGVTGRAAALNETLIIENANTVDFAVTIPGTDDIDESMLAVPLRYERRVTGVIVLSQLGVGRFGAVEARLLEILAGQAAVALENARLYDRERTAAKHAQALLEMAQLVSAGGDERSVARRAVAMIGRLIDGVTAATFHLRTPEGVSHLLASRGLTDQERRQLRHVVVPAEADCPPGSINHSAFWNGEPTFWTAAENDGEHWPQRLAPGVDVPLLAGEMRIGSIDVMLESTAPLRPRDLDLLTGIAHQSAIAIHNRRLVGALEESLLATVEALAGTLEARDQYTSDHAEDIAELSTAVARELGATGGALRDIEWAARFHDIGKIGIPNEILNKPGPLSPDEWEQVKEHPALGARILAPVAQLEGAAGIVHACHEHYDGSGYPDRLSGDAIPLGARVVLVCDAYHAMTSDRPYRRGMTHQLAIQELKRQSGSQFDPQVVAAFMRTHGDVE